MAKDLNKIMITGRLGRDIELRYTQDRTAVATGSIASDRPFRDEKEPSGWGTETTWFRVIWWRDQAERVAKSATKGTRLFVEGRMGVNKYTDKQGQQRESWEVTVNDYIILDGKKSENDGGSEKVENFSLAGAGANKGGFGWDDEPQDLPF